MCSPNVMRVVQCSGFRLVMVFFLGSVFGSLFLKKCFKKITAQTCKKTTKESCVCVCEVKDSCVTKLCEERVVRDVGDAQTKGRGTHAGGSAPQKKQEPHTMMWGKTRMT